MVGIYDNEMKLEFVSKSSNEAFARITVAAFASQLDPTIEELADIKTAVSEAVTNSIIHGYENSEGIIINSVGQFNVNAIAHFTVVKLCNSAHRFKTDKFRQLQFGRLGKRQCLEDEISRFMLLPAVELKQTATVVAIDRLKRIDQVERLPVPVISVHLKVLQTCQHPPAGHNVISASRRSVLRTAKRISTAVPTRAVRQCWVHGCDTMR